MKVVILCGGQGTRIRDVADNLPKPMIPIGGYPILWHVMKGYAQAGHKDFILCLGYMGHVIKDFFLNYQANTSDFTLTLGREKSVAYHGDHDESDWTVTLAETGLESLTGTRVARIKKYIGSDAHFMLTYGDGLSDVDISALLKFHQAHGKIATVTGVRPPGRFGELNADPSGNITEFNEKPQATAGLISGGFFVFSRKIFDYLDDEENQMLEEAPLRRLVGDGQLMAFQHDGFWQCMDTYRDYKLLNGLWENGRAAWKTW